MPYPMPGTYQSAYGQPYGPPAPPQYGQYYGPPAPPQYPPYYGPPAPLPPPQETGQSLIGMLLPILVTQPALRDGTSTAQQLQNALLQLGDPPQVPANPTQADFNKLVNYSISVKNAVTQAVGNDVKVFAALKQSILLQLVGSLSLGGGGSNSSLLLIVLLAFGGLGT